MTKQAAVRLGKRAIESSARASRLVEQYPERWNEIAARMLKYNARYHYEDTPTRDVLGIGNEYRIAANILKKIAHREKEKL